MEQRPDIDVTTGLVDDLVTRCAIGVGKMIFPTKHPTLMTLFAAMGPCSSGSSNSSSSRIGRVYEPISSFLSLEDPSPTRLFHFRPMDGWMFRRWKGLAFRFLVSVCGALWWCKFRFVRDDSSTRRVSWLAPFGGFEELLVPLRCPRCDEDRKMSF